MTIGVCTDSSSLLPPDLAQRYGVEVVPVTVRIDDEEYLEGVDLDADRFYDLLAVESSSAGGTTVARPAISISRPSSGQYALAYDELLSRGCSEIVSVHADASVSGSLSAARLAAHQMGVPVRLVDSGATGFAVSCAVWAAAEAAAAGAPIDEVVALAETTGARTATVNAVGVLEFLSGRCAIPILGGRDGSLQLLDRAVDLEAAAAAMAAYVTEQAATANRTLRVGIGVAHRAVLPLTTALVEALASSDVVDDVVGFRIGPSVATSSAAGTASCVMFPTAT